MVISVFNSWRAPLPKWLANRAWQVARENP
jgi:hypothetical protein